MPVLPSVEDMGTRPIPQSNRQLAVVSNAGAVAEAAGGVGRVLSEVGTKLEEMHNEDDARRLDIQHAEAARKIRQEAEQAQGMNAAAARTTAETQMAALNEATLAQARSHTVREALTPMISRRSGVELDSINSYAQTQTTAAMEGAMTARRDIAIQSAAEHFNNPEAVQNGIDTARAEVANHGQWRGLAPDQIAAEQFTATSRIRAAVAERILGTGDWQAALDYVNTHSDQIDLQSEAALRSAIRGPMLEDHGEAIVDSLPAVTGTTAPVAHLAPPVQPITPGNIDLSQRPAVHNRDGTVSTVRSISIGTDQGEVLIPTVVNGRVVSNAQAIDHYHQTGENLGVFHSAADADRYAQWLHEQEAARVGAPSSARTAPINEGNQPARFQVDGWTVGDGYGASRGDHIHHGVDIFNAAGTPFPVGRPFDIVESHRQTSHGGIGGNIAVVHFQDGSEWIAAHLPNLPAAGHYAAGAPVLRAGNTGTASGTGSHIHWQPANAAAQAIYNQGRHEVAAYLTGGEGGSPAQVAARTSPTGIRIDYAAARAQIDAMGLPSDERRAAITALERRVNIEDGIRTRAGQDAETAITQRLVEIQTGGQRLTSITQIDPSLIRQATQYAPHIVESLYSMIEANNHRQPEANTPLANSLIRMAADDPNGFLRINPELLRGRITDEEVQGIVRTQVDISHRTGPQPEAIMSAIRLAIPPNSPLLIAGVSLPGRHTQAQRNQANTQAEADARANLEARLLPAVQARLRTLGHANISQQDIVNAVQAETMQVVGPDGTRAPVFVQRERGATHFRTPVPPRAIPMIDEALRLGGQQISDSNRANLYLMHRAEIDAATR